MYIYILYICTANNMFFPFEYGRSYMYFMFIYVYLKYIYINFFGCDALITLV